MLQLHGLQFEIVTNSMRSVTSVVSWRQKRQLFVELAPCRKRHQNVKINKCTQYKLRLCTHTSVANRVV